MFTKQQLTPYALALFRRVKQVLPQQIATRLRSSQKFGNHGSYADLFLFDVWDSHQTDVLDRKHFKYCLGYRPNHAGHDGYFHLWLNRIRIYRQREEIVALLDRDLPRVTPEGFVYHPHGNRAFNIGFDFSYPNDLDRLSDLLLPRYVSLIAAVHPILMPIIDQFSTHLKPGERRAVVAARDRPNFERPGVRDSGRVREYTRSVPPSWKIPILEDYDYRCALCRADLHSTGHHFDHIVAFSRGGTTTRNNLQPLCPKCNLRKGHRP